MHHNFILIYYLDYTFFFQSRLAEMFLCFREIALVGYDITLINML